MTDTGPSCTYGPALVPQTNTLIAAHHVGARGFGVAFNTPPAFDSDIVHVLYEADPACAAAMQAENQRGNVFVLPYCLGDRDGEATLHITANPYASSLLTPSADYGKYCCEVMLSGELENVNVQGARYDALYSKENDVVATQPVRMRSLDSLAAEGALPLGRLPDFLSLDTQGSEHAILTGARRIIGRSVLAIATEIEFHAMYDRQPLFSAVLDLANECGFHFAGFTHLQEISPYRAPVGQRAKGFVAFGDAIFLRSLETLAMIGETPEQRQLLALKLAFIAINFGYLEYGLQALQHASQISGGAEYSAQLRERGYIRFVGELRRAAAEMPQIYLHSTRTAVVEQLRSRQRRYPMIAAVSCRLRPVTDRLRGLGEHNPLPLLILLAARGLLSRTLRRVVTLVAQPLKPGGTAGGQISSQLTARYTPIEAVLGEYRFYWIRDQVRRRRLAAMRFAPDGRRHKRCCSGHSERRT